jgi:ubiquinone/menaquinone biosynthesis C-methylase UbiE
MEMNKFKQYYNKITSISADFTFLYKKVLKVLPKDSSLEILDVGCGNANFLNYLKTHRNITKLHGIDISKKRIDHANALYKNNSFNLIIGDFFYFNPNIKYDWIVAIEFLEHVPFWSTHLGKMLSLSKKGVILTVPFEELPTTRFCPNCLELVYSSGHINYGFNKNIFKTSTYYKTSFKIIKKTPYSWKNPLKYLCALYSGHNKKYLLVKIEK